MIKPKNYNEEIDWLIVVYKTSDDKELKEECFNKLTLYKLNNKQINNRFKEIKSQQDYIQTFDKYWEKEKQKNALERYSSIEMLRIILFGIFQVSIFYDTGLKELRNFNYKIKFRQRIILLILSALFWFMLCTVTYKYYEYKTLKQIEQADITKWENNRIK